MNAHKLVMTSLLSLIISLSATLGPRVARAEFNITLQPSISTQLVKQDHSDVKRHSSSDRTSRDRRRDTDIQMSAHLSFVPFVGQLGADVDYLLNEQLTIGLSSTFTTFAVPDAGWTNINHSIHLKRFIRNSFYVKPAIGIHRHESGGYEMSNIVRRGVSARIEIGNEWYFTDHFGMNLSYGALGVVYNGQETVNFETHFLLPSIRFFGAF